jgi:deazaflavin-dependent oxidoreductase (nitroreductase family)
MKAEEIQVEPPSRLLRLLFRLPLIAYRVGLGGIIPNQIMLTTVGRKSGEPHQVVLDIIGSDKTKGMYYVSVAFGPRSDWFRNLRADPTVRAQIGRRKFTARAVILPRKEAEEMLVEFVGLHRRYARIMMRVIGVRTELSEDEVCALASHMPVIAIVEM